MGIYLHVEDLQVGVKQQINNQSNWRHMRTSDQSDVIRSKVNACVVSNVA